MRIMKLQSGVIINTDKMVSIEYGQLFMEDGKVFPVGLSEEASIIEAATPTTNYTVLTPEQRNELREKLVILNGTIINVNKNGFDGHQIAHTINTIQTHIGEHCKTFEEKIAYIGATIKELNAEEVNNG